MKKLILGALCALFFIACGDSSGGKMSKEEREKLESKYYEEIGEAKNIDDKLKIAKKYCDKGFANSCETASTLIMDINPSIEAFNYYVKACELGIGWTTCVNIAKMYKGGKYGEHGIENLDYNPEKIIYYLKKACEFGSCREINDIEKGAELYMLNIGWSSEYLKTKEDAKKYLNIDEYVKRAFPEKECDEFCNLKKGLIYAKGASAGPEYRDAKKSKRIFLKSKNHC